MKYKIKCIENNYNNKRPTNVIIGHIINFNGCR